MSHFVFYDPRDTITKAYLRNAGQETAKKMGEAMGITPIEVKPIPAFFVRRGFYLFGIILQRLFYAS